MDNERAARQNKRRRVDRGDEADKRADGAIGCSAKALVNSQVTMS